MDSHLVNLCIEAATESRESIEKWRKQRRTLERLPSPLADALFRRLHQQRLLFPSLLEVFKHSAEEIDLSGDRTVDAEWLAYIGSFKCLQSLCLADCPRINNSALWNLTGMSGIREIDLSRCMKLNNTGLRYLTSIPSLEILRISESSVTPDGLCLLSSLKNLLVLDLGGLPVTDKTMTSLQALSKLEQLDLWGSEITDAGAACLSLLPNLKSLNIAMTYVRALPSLKSIECLNMSHCTVFSVSDETVLSAPLTKLVLSGSSFVNNYEALLYIQTNLLKYLDVSSSSLSNFFFLSLLKSIEYLDLSSSFVEDSSLQFVADVGSNLKHLNLNKTKITSEGVAILAGHVPKLQYLCLSHTLISDSAVSFVGMMPSLKSVDLSSTAIRGFDGPLDEDSWISSLEGLQSLSELENVNLECTKIRDADLSPLLAIQKLRKLYLRNAALTDSSLHFMSSLSRLKHLGFCDAVLTDDGLTSFNPPKGLETLDLSGCWLLSGDTISSFRRRHTRIKVVHELLDAHQQQQTSILQSRHARINRLNLNNSPTSPIPRYFIDQRVKYNREELLAMRFSSVCMTRPSHNELLVVGECLATESATTLQ